jgi:hypothetical protein
MGLLEQVMTPGEIDEVELHPDTVWSVLGTPMLDPIGGTSDGARSMTMRRALTRAVTHRAPLGQLITSCTSHAERAVARDLAVIAALGHGKRRTEPWTGLRPDSVAQLRVFLTQGQLLMANRDLEAAVAANDITPIGHCLEMLGNARLIGDATPFFIPASIAAALMTSDPPDETLLQKIRLPFPAILTFFDAIPLGELELDGNVFDTHGSKIDNPEGFSLIGVILHSRHDGVGLDLVVEWIVSLPATDTHAITLVAGVWQASAQPGVITNLAALCTWGAWTPPPSAPPQLEGDEGSRQWRRALGRSAVRKALTRGAVIGVHVVDLPALRRTANATSPNGEGPTRGVRTHWRKGFWNRVRVAERDADGNIVGDRLGIKDLDWHYEGRWIHPLLVQGTASNVVTVYSVREDAPNRSP